MSLFPSVWLELKFKPASLVEKRIETLAHDAISGRVRVVLIGPNILVTIRSLIEDAIERP